MKSKPPVLIHQDETASFVSTVFNRGQGRQSIQDLPGQDLLRGSGAVVPDLSGTIEGSRGRGNLEHVRNESLRASDIGLYAHAPYLINVGSPNNRVRIPSRKILGDTITAAQAVSLSPLQCKLYRIFVLWLVKHQSKPHSA